MNETMKPTRHAVLTEREFEYLRKSVWIRKHANTHTHTHGHTYITTHYMHRLTGDRVRTEYGMITEA